ncbi:MAG: aryl-sulfate sulfotransferase [Planctomycetota bacterium]
MVSVYPTGTTIYRPDRCWNGYTMLAGATLIDMNGRVRGRWDDIQHGKPMPGGQVLGEARAGHRIVQVDWEQNTRWEFDGAAAGEDLEPHHDFQREGSPVGYYAPDMPPKQTGRTLILCRTGVDGRGVVAGRLLDDRIIEVDEDGAIVWEWRSLDHVDDIGLDEAARNTLYRASTLPRDYDGLHSPMHGKDPYDWLHSNSASYVGPNKWYDAGDERFHPENIIWDSRDTNKIAIISRETGAFTWEIGPDYSRPDLRDVGQIIGQHHAHVIPRGLPGEGNVLVFDNGGFAGYGPPNPGAPIGEYNAVRPYSRVIEFDPITLERTWEYSARTAGRGYHHHHLFYSPFMSSAQRLPNGNTLVCEADSGRAFEVTTDCEIVWEYVVPPDLNERGGISDSYRAYRLPYEWVPEIRAGAETPVEPPDLSSFHVEPAR